ncbi:MAG: type II toxin-antitoxin system Phd/YefM family antitoxin [Chloroflexi bacterium]|nr:type II toxin-antitoxin system Phd/YefM family antitoxin [Chloroflexota bacterium]
MTQVTIHEAKTHLSRLIQKALQGEEIIIAKGKKPLVKLVVLPEARQQRRLGGAKDVVIEMAADFDAPLNDFKEYMGEDSA